MIQRYLPNPKLSHTCAYSISGNKIYDHEKFPHITITRPGELSMFNINEFIQEYNKFLNHPTSFVVIGYKKLGTKNCLIVDFINDELKENALKIHRKYGQKERCNKYFYTPTFHIAIKNKTIEELRNLFPQNETFFKAESIYIRQEGEGHPRMGELIF